MYLIGKWFTFFLPHLHGMVFMLIAKRKSVEQEIKHGQDSMEL
jgi:hypothetical protein